MLNWKQFFSGFSLSLLHMSLFCWFSKYCLEPPPVTDLASRRAQVKNSCLPTGGTQATLADLSQFHRCQESSIGQSCSGVTWRSPCLSPADWWVSRWTHSCRAGPSQPQKSGSYISIFPAGRDCSKIGLVQRWPRYGRQSWGRRSVRPCISPASPAPFPTEMPDRECAFCQHGIKSCSGRGGASEQWCA